MPLGGQPPLAQRGKPVAAAGGQWTGGGEGEGHRFARTESSSVHFSAHSSLAVSIGGIAGPAIGAVADATSLQTALAPLIVLPALGWILLHTLNEPELLDAAATGQPAAGTTGGIRGAFGPR